MRFWKVESVGNDFVLVHAEDLPESESAIAALAVRACDRHFGIGSDGLLSLARTPDRGLALRMFNPDGTEDFCGNGIRCAFDHALKQEWADPDDLRMTHHGVKVTGKAVGPAIEFQLPPATYEPSAIPIHRDSEAFDTELFSIDGKIYRGSVLSTGTAHTIIPVTELPGDEEFLNVSPQIESHPMFPERSSVMWSETLSPVKIRLRIWERGVGETMGCGSGTTAAAIDFLRRSGSGGAVEVVNPGGELAVRAESWQKSPTLIGEAREVFSGELLL